MIARLSMGRKEAIANVGRPTNVRFPGVRRLYCGGEPRMLKAHRFKIASGYLRGWRGTHMNQGTQRYGELVGQRLFGDYVVTRKLGEGGMGAVYLARQEAINQDIAIKVLHGRAAESQEIIERFNREARVISMLTHPNIIRVFIFGRTPDNLMYMAMEYVNGREMREELRKGPMDELVAIKVMKQTCSALQEAHDLDIVHRDLKPDNLLLTEFRGESHFVKILDFGIAKITNQEGQEKQLTQAGIVYGTPEYLSPEQAQAKELDHRTDIYSLGVMLYETMTGRVPYQSSSAVEVLTMHVFNDPKPPSQVAPQRISASMEKIILKAMAKNPDDRFQNAMEMFRALEMREREILSERGMGTGANYVPGSELTGIFHAVDEGGSAAAPAPAPAARQPNPQAGFQGASVPSTVSMQNSDQGGDSARKIIILVIVISGLILVFLLAVIAMLALK